MTKEKVIGFSSGVIEPEGFGESEIATEIDLGFLKRIIGKHFGSSPERNPK
jgi:hypothetical protein